MTRDRNPTLSVTVTNFNYGRYLPENFDSILGQTFEDFEVVVVDNASTDDSVDVLQVYAARDSRIVLHLRDTTQTAIESFRQSCALSRGTFRVHVDADDWVESPAAFERQVAQMQSDPTVMFTYPAMATHGEDGEAYVHHFYDSDRILEGFEAIETILRLSLGHSGMMLRLDGYRRCGGYPEGFKYYDDVMLAAKLCELGRVGYIDEALYRSRQHGVNENLSVSIDVVEREVLHMIDEILDGPLGAKVPDRERLRRRLRQRALVHQATMFAFNDQPRMALRLLRESARRHPTETIVQPATLGLLARVLVGKSGFDGLQRVRTQVTSALGRH